MIPVKSISQLSSFQDQKESLIPFEQFIVDSNQLGICRYGISATNTSKGLYAGDLEDDSMYIEVSYKDKSSGSYVPRKFDFSNYLRYIENALSILNNGIMGVYLTRDQADQLYVKIEGDTMTGPLQFKLDGTNTKYSDIAPIYINDQRAACDEQGQIIIEGNTKAGIKIGNNNLVLQTTKQGGTTYEPTIILNSILTADLTSITLDKPLTSNANVTIPNLTATSAKLTLDHTQINSVLSSNGGIKVSSGNIEATGASSTIIGPTIQAIGTLKGANLDITGAITTNSSTVTILKSTTCTSNLTVNETITGKNVSAITELNVTDTLTANSSGITLATDTTLGSSESAADFIIANGNIIMINGSSKIQFGNDTTAGATNPSISYSSDYKAFLITDLMTSNKLIVGSESPEDLTTDSRPSSHTWTPGDTRVLTIQGDVYCNGGIKAPYLVAGSAVYVANFQAENITATGTFTQEKGIANLTAKRACWA